MRASYEEDMRQLQEVLKIEDGEDHDHREFRIESTGALLDLITLCSTFTIFGPLCPRKSMCI